MSDDNVDQVSVVNLLRPIPKNFNGFYPYPVLIQNKIVEAEGEETIIGGDLVNEFT